MEQRRTTLKTLRDFGFGKLSMEETVQDEVKKFINYLTSTNQQPLDVAGKFNLPVLNVLWRISLGQSYEYDDPKLQHILKLLSDFLKSVGDPAAILHLRNYKSCP